MRGNAFTGLWSRLIILKPRRREKQSEYPRNMKLEFHSRKRKHCLLFFIKVLKAHILIPGSLWGSNNGSPGFCVEMLQSFVHGPPKTTMSDK